MSSRFVEIIQIRSPEPFRRALEDACTEVANGFFFDHGDQRPIETLPWDRFHWLNDYLSRRLELLRDVETPLALGNLLIFRVPRETGPNPLIVVGLKPHLPQMLLGEFEKIGRIAASTYGILLDLEAAHGELAIRGDLLASISHELKGAFTILGSSVSLLQTGRVSAAPVRGSILHSMKACVDHMIELTVDLVNASNPEARRNRLSEAVDVSALLGEIGTRYAPILEQEGIRLEFQLAPEVRVIQADLTALKLIFSNLICNAVKFSPPRGIIFLRGKREAGRYRFSIEDQGPGIAQEDLSRVFQRFWQGKMRDKSGTGIGLWLVKSAVEAAGGAVFVDSRRGEGSIFQFDLPEVKRGSKVDKE